MRISELVFELNKIEEVMGDIEVFLPQGRTDDLSDSNNYAEISSVENIKSCDNKMVTLIY